MKISSLFIVLLCLSFQSNAIAQKETKKLKKIESCEFTVKGVCGMCQTRIEKAALIKGVKMVEWDKDSQLVKVMYASKKVTENEIHKAIAGSGHDTEKAEASDEVYATLPDCCAYRDGVKVH